MPSFLEAAEGMETGVWASTKLMIFREPTGAQAFVQPGMCAAFGCFFYVNWRPKQGAGGKEDG